MMHQDALIAIDVHSNCGAALFDQSGRLLAYDRLGSLPVPALRAAAAEVLGASDAVHWLFSAGQPAAQAVWERAAMREGVRVQRVGQPDWQSALLGAGLSPAAAQVATLALAEQTVAESGLGRGRLSLAEARAICVGLWAAQQLRSHQDLRRRAGKQRLAPSQAAAGAARPQAAALQRVA